MDVCPAASDVTRPFHMHVSICNPQHNIIRVICIQSLMTISIKARIQTGPNIDAIGRISEFYYTDGP